MQDGKRESLRFITNQVINTPAKLRARSGTSALSDPQIDHPKEGRSLTVVLGGIDDALVPEIEMLFDLQGRVASVEWGQFEDDPYEVWDTFDEIERAVQCHPAIARITNQSFGSRTSKIFGSAWLVSETEAIFLIVSRRKRRTVGRDITLSNLMREPPLLACTP